MLENGLACWLLKQDRKEVFTLTKEEALAKASVWIDSLTRLEFYSELDRLIDGINSFYDTLPKNEEDKKKVQPNEVTA